MSLSNHPRGTLETIDGRRALRFERELPYGIERVWRAISEPAEMEQWFVATVDWTPAAGERIDAGGQSVEVTTVEPPRRLAWSWG
ncbi:SRPBCC domain-containing protein, partial [Bradyrhizobium sp. NBAIM08]|uniref:SRPBCC domain-containing protein n=1 Tax=Bradyrhizobium sp. NBAIM08 TaxID=2793815 RepID=UPI001CD50C83